MTIERRAIKRYKQDPSSLAFTFSTLDDLDLIESLLDRVVALAPRLKDCGFANAGMKPSLVHHDLSEQNVILPRPTPDNALDRMEQATIIDWQCTSIIPWAFIDMIPPVIEYEPRLRDATGAPMFDVNRAMDIKPSNEPKIPPELDAHLDAMGTREEVAAKLRLAFRQYRHMELIAEKKIFAESLKHPLAPFLPLLPQSILRACGDGPASLAAILVNISIQWRDEWGGPCPYTFSDEELKRISTLVTRRNLYEFHCDRVKNALECSPDGSVPKDRYEEAVKCILQLRDEWNDEEMGGPFPLDEGRYNQHLS